MNIFSTAIAFAFLAAVISGVNGFLTKPALSAVGDPIVFTFLKNMVVVGIFLCALFLSKKFREIRDISVSDRWRLLAIGIVGGGIPFALYFTGLSMIPAVSATFIHKTMFVWVALLAIPFLGERMSGLHVFALGLLLFGITLFQVPMFHSFGVGEMLVLFATLLWAVENIFAKKVLSQVPVLLVGTARMTIGSLVIFAFVIFSGKAEEIFMLSTMAWGWVLLTGLLLSGFVFSWFRALSLVPATFVACLLVPATFITGTISALFVTHSFSFGQVSGWLCIILGLSVLFIQSTSFSYKRSIFFWKHKSNAVKRIV